ncbi:PAS domain S-box-containing protein [Leeuwenhoekiella aestuarii]|uniref:PAS domain S-box-containing protein n=1 Tax=Leeuwenhoekiella aestuarii TaxID=2249426 RepID=A0A4Q0NSE0_9FLAO|nr:PAS domain-containing protein [Leeuwenhoekiella aestuarii]RXG13908.1 PAS domain S-box-containing protein [Leeuwenhoekiella aestuarii]RXG18656.1 PAS domain S-box-containing protein [Leeuwenhoekiella aestuarii]
MKNNLTDMMGLDLYLSQLTDKKYQKTKAALKSASTTAMPLLSWDMCMQGRSKQLEAARRRMERDYMFKQAKKFKWRNDIKQVFSETAYEALILTDAKQHILWVNDGFTTMTGYSKEFALHKKPAFLQGKLTTADSKENIRQKLKLQQPFQEVIINHKKDGEPYTCEVKIIPLYAEKTTHFIAFERQVSS